MAQSPIPSGHPLQRDAPISATAISSSAGNLLRSPLRTLLAVVFTIDCMTALVVIAFGNSYLIETRHSPPAYPAYALGIYGFVKLLTAPIGGWLLDRVRSGVVVGFVIAIEALGLGVILVTGTAYGFLAGVALLSTGIAMAWLVVFHALGDASDPDLRASATAYVGLTSTAATGTGFGIAAVIGETPYWPAAFIIGLLLAALSGSVLWRLYPPGQTVGRTAPERGAVAADGAVDRRRQVVAGLVIFAHFTAVTGTIAAFGPFVLRTLDLTLLRAGLLMLPAGAVAAAAMVIAGRRSTHGNRLREVAALYAVGAVSVLLASTVHHAWLFGLIAVPLALAFAAAQPLLNASLLDVSHAAERTGTVLGWLFFAEGLGSVVGPLIVGLVISLAGVRAGVVTLSILDSAVVYLAVVGARTTRL
jgi:predicted MFS family arabinose efflux permease